MNTINVLICLAAFGLGCAGACIIAMFGDRWSLMDNPNPRSSHNRATPKGGGVGIMVAFFSGAVLLGIPTYFWVPAVVLSLISLLGDRYNIGVGARLLCQFLSAAYFLAGIFIDNFYNPGLGGGICLFLFFAVFIVGTANYYNFMDGINGIAGITGIIAFGLVGLYGACHGKSPSLITLCFALAAACAGFLPWNLPGAKVFMGDVGSILLGFTFACMVTLFTSSVPDFLVLTGFLFMFYADELVTLIERLMDGGELTRAHRRHLYQVLANEHRVAHWKVSAGYGISQMIIGVLIWLLSIYGIGAIIGVFAVCLCGFIIVNAKVKKIIN